MVDVNMLLYYWLLFLSSVLVNYYDARQCSTHNRRIAIVQWINKLFSGFKSNRFDIEKTANGEQTIWNQQMHTNNETYISKKDSQQIRSSFYKVVTRYLRLIIFLFLKQNYKIS